MIKSFTDLQERLLQNGQKRRIAAVCANDEATLESLSLAGQAGLAEAVYIDDNDPTVAAANAVAMIRRGEADILMKGLIGTDQLLRAILNKENGLLPKGNVMTHMVMAELERYHKLLFMTDVAVIPYPTHEQRIEQVRYAAQICRNMGIEEPRIALLHCAEHGGKQFPFVDGYAEIIQKAEAGDFGPCRVDGPMDLKCACSPEALKAKHMQSSLEGDADVRADLFGDLCLSGSRSADHRADHKGRFDQGAGLQTVDELQLFFVQGLSGLFDVHRLSAQHSPDVSQETKRPTMYIASSISASPARTPMSSP